MPNRCATPTAAPFNNFEAARLEKDFASESDIRLAQRETVGLGNLGHDSFVAADKARRQAIWAKRDAPESKSPMTTTS